MTSACPPLRDLAARLRRVDLLLLRAVLRQRARPAIQAKGDLWGQFITDDEVDELLRAHGELDLPARPGHDALEHALTASLAWRDAPARGSRLTHLREVFGLDGDDVDLLLLATAPEVAAGYGRILAYLHDDVQRAWLTVDLASRVLRTGRARRLQLQRRLLPTAPLFRHRLLLLDPPEDRAPQASRRVTLASRVLQWLLGEEELPLPAGLTRVRPPAAPCLPPAAAEAVAGLLQGAPRPDPPHHGPAPATIALHGGAAGLREEAALAVAGGLGRSLARLEAGRWAAEPHDARDLARDLRLAGDVPYVVDWPGADAAPEVRARAAALAAALLDLPSPLCADGRSARALDAPGRPAVALDLCRVRAHERQEAWRRALDARGWSHLDAGTLAARFPGVVGATLRRVLDRAEAQAGGAVPSPAALASACRAATRPETRGLVRQVTPRFGWDDLVLPAPVLARLRQLEDVLVHREAVMHRWGQQRLRPRGHGLKALFSGSPGTGKTMCAEVLAGALGYDLLVVDLSAVVSKWIGETEKHLREVFDAAEGGSAVLLFDEGDALFAARGETRTAQDRYANQGVAYLLQRLEAYEGCAVVTTNLPDHIDEAFLRRFGAVVEFPLPGPEERRRLWERALPQDPALVDDEVDPAALGRQLHLAGGAIVNVVLHACVQAVAEGAPLGLRHLAPAVAHELHKLGRQVNRVSLGALHDLVEDGR